MAMLAEPRRKQKWSLNPRGKYWSEDSTKFGQKMLEKMGWTTGKGLGANEQGITEHVKVSVKSDTTGIGYKLSHQDRAWTRHQDGFNNFLQQLQNRQTSNVVQQEEVITQSLSGKSLELKSQQSRARVHYKKFTRGKDVHAYSSKDLANIFGQKDLNTKVTINEEVQVEAEEPNPLGSKDERGGVITINSGSMADYFHTKSNSFDRIPDVDREDKLTDSDSEQQYAGFGFASTPRKTNAKGTAGMCNYGFVNPCLSPDSPAERESPSGSRKNSKKRKSESRVDRVESDCVHRNKKQKGEDTAEECKEGLVNPALNLENQTEDVCNGKDFEVSRAEFGFANSGLDLTDEPRDKRRVTFNDHVEYSTDCVKKKKGNATLDKFEVENKKQKKKRKREESSSGAVTPGFVNEGLDMEDVSEEINDNEINERKSKKSKRRKERRSLPLETIEESPEEDRTFSEEISIGTTGPIECIPDNSHIVDPRETTSKEKIKKKKKKRKDSGEEEGTVNEIEIISETVVSVGEKNEEPRGKSSKKGKKKKKRSKNELESSVDEQDLPEKPKKFIEVIQLDGEPTGTKKKKRRIIEVVTITDENEISDKENTNDVHEDSEQIPKKSKKHKSKSKEQLTLEPSSTTDNTESPKTVKCAVQPVADTSLAHHTSKTLDKDHDIISTPSHVRSRMPKKLLKALFHRNSVHKFPGANIHEMQGYGTEV